MAFFYCTPTDMTDFYCTPTDMTDFYCTPTDMTDFNCTPPDMTGFNCTPTDMTGFNCTPPDMTDFYCTPTDMTDFNCTPTDMTDFNCTSTDMTHGLLLLQRPVLLPACTIYIFNLLCTQIKMDGTPTDSNAWPTFAQRKYLLRCQPARFISSICCACRSRWTARPQTMMRGPPLSSSRACYAASLGAPSAPKTLRRTASRCWVQVCKFGDYK